MIEPKTENWGGKPIEEYAVWEQREIWSYTPIITSPNFRAVKQIVDAICKNKIYYTWNTPLTIVDEGMIQKLLRMNGFDIRCYELNTFPRSVAELTPYLIDLPLTTKQKLKNTFEILAYPAVSALESMAKFYLDYQSIILTVAVLFGLIMYHFELSWPVIVWACAISSILVITVHEDWEHQFIKPKNRFFGYIFDFMTYFMVYPTQKSASLGHLYHHRFFQGPRDLTLDEIRNNSTIRWFFKYKLKYNKELAKWYRNQSQKDFEPQYKQLDAVSKFLEDQHRWVIPVVHVLLVLLLGLQHYFYFILLPIWWHRMSLYNVIELVSHKICTRGQDFPWAYPIVLNLCYHNSHHKYPDKLIIGPNPIRYFNPQYYFIKLFYNSKVEMI